MKKTTTAAALLLAASITAASVSRLDMTGATLLTAGAIAPASRVSAAASAGDGSGTPVSEIAGVTSSGLARALEPFEALTFLSPALADADFVLNQAIDAGPGVAAPQEPPAVPTGGNAIRMSMPFRTQKDGDRFQGSNCGPATLGMVLEGFGMQQGNSELRLLTHTYQGTVGARTGTALQHMAHVAADFGLQPIGLYLQPNGSYPRDGFARWTVEDIRAEVLAGRPVVPLVKFRLVPGHEDSPFRADHYVVIHGVDGDSFLYHDPIYDSPWEGGARWMSSEQLAAAMRPTLIPQQAVAFAPGSHAALATFSR